VERASRPPLTEIVIGDQLGT